MDDLGLNKYLEEQYGKTIDGQVLFRLVWSTEQLEKRKGTFCDFHDDLFIREVTEVRECPKYPMAEDRWVLEVIAPVPDSLYNTVLFTRYTYEGIYIFADKEGNFLPLSREMLEAAMYLYLVFHQQMTYGDRLDFRMAQLAAREKERKEKIRAEIGETLRSPLFFTLEDPHKYVRRK